MTITANQKVALAMLKKEAREKRAAYHTAKAAYDTAKQVEREAEAEALRSFGGRRESPQKLR